MLIRKREISAQEAAFRLCHLPLRRSSRVTVFVPVFKPEKRIRVLHQETLWTDQAKASMNMIDRYELRPESLEEISLLEFCAWYAPRKNPKYAQSEEDVIEGENDEQEEDQQKTKYLSLKDGKGHIFRRSRNTVVKYPFFNPIEQKEDYLYSLLLLLCPFRNEQQFESLNTAEAFKENRDRFRTNQDDEIIKVDLMEELHAAFLRMEAESDEGQEGEDGFDANQIFEETHEEFHVNELFPPINENLRPTDMLIQMRLNQQQQKILDEVKHSVRQGSNGSQLLKFISGAGGVGKSYLIKAITLLIQGLCPNGERAILKVAPTGVAGRNIQGVTIHKGFSLGVENQGVAKFFRLGGRKLHERRLAFKHVKYVILDEVSMVSYEVLRNIHQRLQEIFENDLVFGGIHFILFSMNTKTESTNNE